MADLTSNLRSNLSGSRVTQQAATPTGSGSRASLSSNPATSIPESVRGYAMDTSTQWTFPPNLAPLHFGFIETEWTLAKQSDGSAAFQEVLNTPTGQRPTLENSGINLPGLIYGALENLARSRQPLVPKKVFRLPLPIPLKDQFQVNYNTNFAPMSILEGVQDIGSAALGVIPNTFKTVTLSQPDYRRHQFTFTLPPRNYSESVTIQKIIHAIRRGMHPKRSSVLGGAVMVFPYIYLPYFMPNPKFLYKFKPCVIENIQVDYQGGQPVPAFYKQQGAPENRPPETVSLAITFLELEYWLDGEGGDTAINKTDFKQDGSGLPTNDPFDSFNYYQLASQAAPTT